MAGLSGAVAADCGTRCSRWPDTRKMGDVQPSSVVSPVQPGSGIEVTRARFGASVPRVSVQRAFVPCVLRSTSIPRVSRSVSVPRASASGPLFPHLSVRACDGRGSPRAHLSFPACSELRRRMRLQIACVRHGQAVHRDGGMWGRGRAVRLVWYVCGTTIWTCREITHDGCRVGGRGGAYAAAVGAGVAQKKRPPACLVSRCHRVHAFGDFVLMRKAGTWLALELL